RIAPATTGATRSTPRKSTSWAGRRATGSVTPCGRPWIGIKSTKRGGARSSPESSARTTNASTGAEAAEGCARCRPSRGRRPRRRGAGAPAGGGAHLNELEKSMKRVVTLSLATLLLIPAIVPGAPTSAPDRRLNPADVSALPSFIQRVEPAVVGLRVRNA